MEKQSGLAVSKYSCIAAMYQPDQAQTRRTVILVLLLLTVFLIGIATRAHAGEKAADCGGIHRSALHKTLTLATQAAPYAWTAGTGHPDRSKTITSGPCPATGSGFF